jgi:hypothetical protein
MYELLIGAILVLLFFQYGSGFLREHFVIDDIYLPQWLGGSELVTWTPNSCPPGQEIDAGLCYQRCRNGYHGVGPVCWVDSYNRGIGVPILLEPCNNPERKKRNLPTLPSDVGWFTEGLICREPITGGGCNTHCDGNWSWSDGGFCHTHCDPIVGGRLVGRLNNGGICPDNKPDRNTGLCYSNCPKDKPNAIAGMPYLCYVGGDLSYGRGVGKIPSLARVINKYTVF